MMLQHTSLAVIAFFSASIALHAQDADIPTPPLNSGHADGGSSELTIPIRPTGKYKFLAGFIPTSEEEKVRDSLPYEWIEIRWMIPGQLYKNVPPVDHRLRLNRDGTASYVTGSFGDDVTRSATVELDDFGRYCLLLEQLGIGDGHCDLGRTVAISHPVESILRVKPVNGALLTFRNADRLGDYRFWLVKTVLLQQVNALNWKTVRAAKSTEP
ncbi:MAG: hypothetical protein NXI28_27360 [bacterium]|jgi:hypothetical protein|nr:hypothetical protein [bacterium]